MPTALALSPHLDDVAFSCGGTVALLADRGWRVMVATVFTRSIHPAGGFALACQRDKGLADSVDYMALRRDEDAAATALLGAEPCWLDLPEAPHRGYDSAPALFGAVRDDDAVEQDVIAALRPLLDRLRPDIVLAPQGLGNHVDHQHVVRAAVAVCDPARLVRYRDTPYAMRLPGRGDGVAVMVADGMDRKCAASCAYASQIGFQFGGMAQTAVALRDFAQREGGGVPAERFLADADAAHLLMAA